MGTIRNGVILGSLLIGIVAFAKLIISIWLKGPENWMDKTLPIVSMSGIVFIIAIIMLLLDSPWSTLGTLVVLALNVSINVFQEIFTKKKLEQILNELRPQSTLPPCDTPRETIRGFSKIAPKPLRSPRATMTRPSRMVRSSNTTSSPA